MSKQRITGKVKFFNTDKGFGFIVPDDLAAAGGRDTFVHASQLKKDGIKDLKEGDALSYEVVSSKVNGQDKTSAINVRRAQASAE